MGLSFVYFFFNIGSIAVFRYHRVERIAYVLPIYHLIAILFFISIGLILMSLGTVSEWVLGSLRVMGISTSLFEIVFSLYLLNRIGFTREI